MISFLSPASLYFSMNSSALENALCVIYFSTSSASSPRPVSEKVTVFAFSSVVMLILGSGISFNPSRTEICCNLVIASKPLDTNSLKNISWSEYNHFLIIGKIFCMNTNFAFFINCSLCLCCHNELLILLFLLEYFGIFI